MTRLLLGCDGGGTKTVAELAVLHDDGKIETCGEGVAGPGNVLGGSSQTALGNLENAIDVAFQMSGLEAHAVDAMVLSLAGAGRESERTVIHNWMKNRELAKRLEIVPDCRAVFEAGIPDGIGVVLVAGTGSIAMGRSPDGNFARCGGWGPLLGDEGGGYWIGINALRTVMHQLVNRSFPSPLATRVLHRFNASTAEQLTSRVYASETSRTRIAQTCIDVFDTADDDVLSSEIVEQAAKHLAELVVQTARRAHLDGQPFSLAMAGSVLVHQPSLRQRICDICTNRSVEPRRPTTRCRSPCAWCVDLLAKRLVANAALGE